MARKKAVQTKTSRKQNKTDLQTDLLSYFRLSESYTSLLLGVIVVIIAAVLLLSLIRNNPAKNSQKTQVSSTKTVDTTKVAEQKALTPTIEKEQPTATPQPTQFVQAKKSQKPQIQQSQNDTEENIYTVKTGDSLWKIAENKYKDGYKWTLIAKGNRLENPGLLAVGQKLEIPRFEAPMAQMEKPIQIASPSVKNAISGTSYTVVRGDTLWDISVRAYGDGFKWPEIARVNILTNPDLIFSGNILKIPRI